MGKKKGDKAGRGSAQAGLVAINPLEVRFTHSRLRPQFSCGRRVEDTLDDLAEGKISVADLPPITLVSAVPGSLDGPFFSLNNRRLFVMKELCRRGVINEVMARVKPPVESKRESERYTIEKCSLTAKLMGVKEAKISEENEPKSSTHEEDAPPDTTADSNTRPDKLPMDWKKTIGDVTVYGIDANSLLPKKWVRDPVISAFFEVLQEKTNAAGKKKIKFIQPPMSLLVQHGNDPSVVGDLTGTDILIAAVNNSSSPECAVSGSHWSLLVWDGSSWSTYDSFNGANDAAAEVLARALHPLVSKDAFSSISANPNPSPQQRNTSDCGVHLLMNTAKIVEPFLCGMEEAVLVDAGAMRGYMLDLLWRL
eukprot:TRINITY_DN13855_c0_g1_i1.p1 TRINITY_DN13855_c0_g1~~TRINITY_DN13855_c0_g1_i1.p1  ORF type:complete len:385 (+),score=90.43 TRINITY_DN13855_c0_g1_i1:58-1155(+)